MTFIQKNETGFHWGPRATSRQGRQVELAVCVRGVFRLAPGQPLEELTDPLDQGFMSGEVWEPTDLARKGPIRRHSDFADWKPNTDLLLKGTCYPPGGADVVCDVSWGVGEWSKTLRVYGPRTYKPGLVFGGSISDPEPFQSMPLDWSHAYGGEGHPTNPGGKGFVGPEMHNVEDPRQAVTKPGKNKVGPATFLPLSMNWPERWSKVGKKYGKSWEKHRSPWPAEDFDWSFHNCAPADQQLPHYLRGDERVWFRNLHPEAPEFEVRLPALRLRVFVKQTDGTIHDLQMVLDTLLADLEEGRLELTWRGLCPIGEIDMSDVKVVYVAKEPLAEQPKPREHYLELLAAFEDDPIGFKEQAPPGFIELKEAVDQKAKAELYGGPMPDFAKVAQAFPKDGRIPPWAVAAMGLSDQPLEQLKLVAEAQGVELPRDPAQLEAMAQQMKAAKDDPRALAATLREQAQLSDPATRPMLEQAAADLERAADAQDAQQGPTPTDDPAVALDRLAEQLPPGESREAMRAAAGQVRSGLEQAQQAAAKLPEAQAALQAALAKPRVPKPRASLDETLAGASEAGAGALQQALDKLQAGDGDPGQIAELTQAKANLQQSLGGIPSFDQMVGEALAPLERAELPEVPELPNMSEKMLAQMDADEALWRTRLGEDHALLGVFDLGRRYILGAARKLSSSQPDLSGALDALDGLGDQLLALGASAAAIAPLVAFRGRLAEVLSKLVGAKERPEKRDYAGQELPGADFSGQDLSGRSFAGAKLGGARFSGANLQGADLRNAELRGAQLDGADLREAQLDGADLSEARLDGAKLSGARMADVLLQDASLVGIEASGANLEGAVLQTARLDDADLRGANLSGVLLTDTSFERADLSQAILEAAVGSASFRGAKLVEAKLGAAQLPKCDLRGVDMSGADLQMVNFAQSNGQGLVAPGIHFHMASFKGSRLDGANLRGAKATIAYVDGCDLRGADLREVYLEKCSFAGSQLSEADLSDGYLKECDFRDVVAERARFLRVRAPGSSSGGEARFEGCNFVGFDAEGCKWMGVAFSGCDFSHARLRSALWRGCQGTDLNFYAADMKQIVLRKANLERVSFVAADLNGVDLCESRLLDIQFTKSNLYDAKFMDVEMASCDFNAASMGLSRFDRTPGAPK